MAIVNITLSKDYICTFHITWPTYEIHANHMHGCHNLDRCQHWRYCFDFFVSLTCIAFRNLQYVK